MHIAFVTIDDPDDVSSWSGTSYFMPRALREAGCEVTMIGPLRTPYPPAVAARKLQALLQGRRYLGDRHPAVQRAWARQAARRIRRSGAQAVLTPSSMPVAQLKIDLPVVLWTDATIASMLGFYERFTNLSKACLRHAHDAERRALQGAAVAAFSSQWAADSARTDYGVDSERLHVVSFGANLTEPPTVEQVESMLAARSNRSVDLLLVGVEWQRKGVPLAIEAVRLLRERGYHARLTVVGCEPAAGQRVPEWVQIAGFISKHTDAGRAQLHELFASHHLLILPSLAECTAITFCEAYAYGVPCVASDVGGTRSVIVDGQTGVVVAAGDNGSGYADAVAAMVATPDRYREFAWRSRREFEKRCNWEHAGRVMCGLIERAAAH